jgi:tetratricopeptide (TPR) repeat protein
MKFFVFAFLILLFSNSYGQNNFSKLLLNNWKKEEIRRNDGSKVYDQTIEKVNFDLNFISKDSVQEFFENKLNTFYYQLKDSVLTFNKMVFNIKKLNEYAFVINQANIENDMVGLSIKFIPKKLADLTFSPEYYSSKNGDKVYSIIPGRLEPLFFDKTRSSLDFIIEKFAFPEYRKGGFVVRFVVTKKAEVKGIKIVASSNDRFNAKLIDAISKTKGKWKAAEFLGENVNVEIEYDFNLGMSQAQLPASEDSVQTSQTYYGYGNEFFERKAYKQAEAYFTKSLSYNPLNINSYYQRAASNIFLMKKEDACKDYQQLIYMEQSKAKTLFEKYCKQ